MRRSIALRVRSVHHAQHDLSDLDIPHQAVEPLGQGANVILVATTPEVTQNKLVVAADDGSAVPAVTTMARAAGADTVFRGGALAPQ